MTGRHRKTRSVPRIWLLTDERVATDALLIAAARLPKGQGGVILRHYRSDPKARRALFDALARVAQKRRLMLMLAGTARQAAAWKADGWHGRDRRRATRPLMHSAPVHDVRELQLAARSGADFILLSPLFPTRSHPGGATLGHVRFARLARLAKSPVIALGGVQSRHERALPSIGASGWAAIDGLTARPPDKRSS